MIKKLINQVVDAISAPQAGETDIESRDAALRSATAVLMPAVASLAVRAKIAPSRLFMPLAFGAILGGTTTLVGTPPNILAVLMLDVARADHVFDESEFERVLDLVETHFGIPPEDAAELVNAADDKAENLVSLHEFTQLLHNNLDESEKARIVGLLWQVAYADGRLDKYEDSLVRKISDLLHVSRGLSMRLKHDAEEASR